ncbi:MAG: DUF4157 domain-containing protein [Chitinophagales bacterium]
MKVSKNKNSKASNTSRPFFKKDGEGSFFSQTQEAEKPFFSPVLQNQKSNLSSKNNQIQAKKNTEASSKEGSNGQSLPDGIKNKMENSFQTDFSDVNIHENSDSAQKLGALAYTQGNNIHFAPKQFNTGSKSGQELIGHELTHVVQQRQETATANIQQKNAYVNESSALEKEADTMGKIAANGKQAVVKGKGSGIQKKSLSPEERVELRRLTGNRIDKAYTDFIDAAEQVKAEIHDATDAQKEFIFLIADIALGYLLPGAGKALAKRASKLPKTATNELFIKTFSLLDEGTIDAHLGMATKVGTQALKNNYTKITDISKMDAFIAKLKTETRDGFDKTDVNLSNLTDLGLATTYLAFGTALTNASTYKAQIKKTVDRFKSQVVEVGKRSSSNSTVPHSQTNTQTGVMWLEYKPEKWVLSKIKVVNTSTLRGGSTNLYFQEMIDKDMGAMARQAGNATQSKGVQDLTLEKQAQMNEYGQLHNFPTSFPAGKYYFVTVK